jgi:hypothetical protein
MPRVIEFAEQFPASTHTAYGSSRVAEYEVEIGDRLRNHWSHADHCKSTDLKVAADRASRANRRAGANDRLSRFFIGILWAQSFQVRSRRAGKLVIRKDWPSANHDTVFNRHAKANVNERVDLDAVSDLHVVGDMRLFADDTITTYGRALPNVDIVPDGCAITQWDAILDDRRFVNSYVGHIMLRPVDNSLENVSWNSKNVRHLGGRRSCWAMLDPIFSMNGSAGASPSQF